MMKNMRTRMLAALVLLLGGCVQPAAPPAAPALSRGPVALSAATGDEGPALSRVEGPALSQAEAPPQMPATAESPSVASTVEPRRGRAEAGKALVIKQECLNCHSIKGDGGSQGPDLTQVTLRRSREWLNDFIYVPSEKYPDATMPQMDWGSEQEVADVVAFLESLKRDVPTDKIFAANLGPVKTGQALVETYDCRACHTIGEGGIAGYPDLTYIGSKIRPEWEAHWLKDPQQVKPGTFMPTFKLGEREIQAIVAYLASLKWDQPPGGSPLTKEE